LANGSGSGRIFRIHGVHHVGAIQESAMSNLIPPGYIHEGHGVYESVGRGGIVTLGMAASWPDLSSSRDGAPSEFSQALRIMLTNVHPGEKVQFTCTTSSAEFAAPLGRFNEHTASLRGAPDLCIRTRTELVNRYRKAMADQTLIQSSARIYLSARMEGMVKDGKRIVRGFDDTFEVFRRSFQHRCETFDSQLKPFGGSVQPLDNAGLYRDLLAFWSPWQARQALPKWIDEPADVNWLRPVSDLCRFSDLAHRDEHEQGFCLDGHYFGVVVAKVLPSETFGCMRPLLNLTIPGLRIVLNAEPLDVTEERQAIKKKYKQLASNIDAQDPDIEVEEGIDLPRQRMRGILAGNILPYRAQLLVVVHDRSRDALDERIEAVRAALGKVGCEAFLPSLPTSTVAFYNRATPGYGPWSRYEDYCHRVSDAVNAADLAPAGSTPKGDLDEADAIFDGDNGNLIGMRMMLGSQPVSFPIIGPAGGGKSAIGQSILAQVAANYSFIAVIDNKHSYAETCRELDPKCEPIVIRSNGGMTFNPFHLHGPLSPGAISDAAALAHLLVGRVSDEDKDKLRGAILSQTVQRLYDEKYRTWRNKYPNEHLALCEEASILLELWPGISAEEAWSESRVFRSNPDWAVEGLVHFRPDGTPDDDACLALSRDPATADFVRDLAFTKFEPWQFPTLHDLQDELNTMAVQGAKHKELCGILADLLQPWLRDGRYGAILDGPNNVDLGSTDFDERTPLRILVFELSEIAESEKDLRAVMGFLLANQIKNFIQGMRRDLRKMVIFEELESFVTEIPDGAKMVADYYRRGRAYQTQVITVFQQWGSLLESSPEVARAIMGNSLAVLLLKNKHDDLEAISRSLKLPQAVKDKIMSFPLPESLRGKPGAYAAFAWCTLHGKEPVFTVGRNYLSTELDRLVSSSGDVYEQIKKERNAIKNKAA
jgi:hypothetical protein